MKSFKHIGGGGDMIYGLATMKELGGGLLHINTEETSSYGSFFSPLLSIQPYIKQIKYHNFLRDEWDRIEVDFNLDLFRDQDTSKYTLIECHARAFNINFDFTKPWIFNIEPKYVADIVINDTGLVRWPGNTVEWLLLKPYRERCIFIGLEGEHKAFEKDTFKIKHYQIQNSLEFSQIIKGSKLYVGNQSTGLALAEGMKVPRVADLFIGGSKQYPHGDNGHYTLTTELIEYYLGR